MGLTENALLNYLLMSVTVVSNPQSFRKLQNYISNTCLGAIQVKLSRFHTNKNYHLNNLSHIFDKLCKPFYVFQNMQERELTMQVLIFDGVSEAELITCRNAIFLEVVISMTLLKQYNVFWQHINEQQLETMLLFLISCQMIQRWGLKVIQVFFFSCCCGKRRPIILLVVLNFHSFI